MALLCSNLREIQKIKVKQFNWRVLQTDRQMDEQTLLSELSPCFTMLRSPHEPHSYRHRQIPDIGNSPPFLQT